MARRGLGTLTLDLIARIGGFTGPMDKAGRKTRNTSKDMEKYAKRIGASIAAAGAAYVTSIAVMVNSSRQLIDEQAKLARSLGGTIAGMDTLARAAGRAGVSKSEMATAAQRLNQRLGEAIQRGGPAADVLKRLGLNAEELSRMDVDERFAAISNRMRDMGVSTQIAASMLRDLGIRQSSVVTLMQEGGDAIENSRRRLEQYGVLLTEIDAAKVEAMNDSFQELSIIKDGLAKQLTVQLAPAIQAVTDMLSNAVVEAGGMGPVAERSFNRIIGAAAFVIDAIDGIRRVFKLIADSMIIFVETIVKKIADGFADVLRIANSISRFIPGIDFSDALESVEQFSERSAGIISEARESIQDTLNKPLAGTVFKQIVVEANEASALAAEAAVRTRDQMERLYGEPFDPAAVEAAEAQLQLLRDTLGLAESGLTLAEAQAEMDQRKAVAMLEQQGYLKTQIAEHLKLSKAIAQIGENEKDIEKSVEALERLRGQIDPAYAAAQDFKTEMESLAEIFAKGLIDESEFDRITKHLEEMRDRATDVGTSFAESMAALSNQSSKGLRSMQRAFEQGSKGYKALEVAIQAVNLAQAIGAVLNQGTGDPYTAFARMAAMAAAVAALGVSINNMSGSGGGSAQARQANQGTGTVFGDMNAQSQSIANATEITANATSKLVGLSRGMLNALQQMSAGIQSVTANFARGGFNVGDNVTGLGSSAMLGSGALYGQAAMMAPLAGPLATTLVGVFREPLNSLNKELWKQSRKIKDSGIMFLGQAMGDIMDGAMLEAFQYADIETKKKAAGITYSRNTRQVLEEIEDTALRDLTRVFFSMGDAVMAGAETLGLAGDEVERRLREFEIAAQMISLDDLSSEEQQEAIEAVFSSIFDGMANAVVPFIDEFSRLGEGAGETLARVATQVAVMDEAVNQLGITMGDKAGDPRLYAHAADGLIELTGGLENFINQFTGFIDKFASDQQKFQFASDQLNSAFSEMGLSLPATSEGMWELMQSMDGTTEAGRQQIATLLGLQDAASNYYRTLERLENQRQGLEIQLLRELGRDTQATAMQRRLELAAMHESLRPLQERIWALQDEKMEIERLGAATDDAMRRVRDSISQRISELSRRLDAQIDQINDHYEKRSASLSRWLETQLKSYARQIDRVSESVRGLTALSNSLARAIDSHRSTGPENDLARRIRAQRDLDAALGMARMGQFVSDFGFIDDLIRIDPSMFGSQAEMQFDTAVTSRRLQELNSLTEDQLSVEEQLLESLELRREQAQENHDRQQEWLQRDRDQQIERAQRQHDQQVALVQSQLKAAEQQINELRGIDESVMSLTDAMKSLEIALREEAAMGQDRMVMAIEGVKREMTRVAADQKDTNRQLVAINKEMAEETRIINLRAMQ